MVELLAFSISYANYHALPLLCFSSLTDYAKMFIGSLELNSFVLCTYSSRPCHPYIEGQVESDEVKKRKYGNRSTEVRRKAAYQCLLPY